MGAMTWIEQDGWGGASNGWHRGLGWYCMRICTGQGSEQVEQDKRGWLLMKGIY